MTSTVWRRCVNEQTFHTLFVSIYYLIHFDVCYFTIHNYVLRIEWMDTVNIRSQLLRKFLLLYKRKYTISCINNNNCNRKVQVQRFVT